jgi:hypothetical protein
MRPKKWDARSRRDWCTRMARDLGLRYTLSGVNRMLMVQLSHVQEAIERLPERAPIKQRLRLNRAFQNTLQLLQRRAHR